MLLHVCCERGCAMGGDKGRQRGQRRRIVGNAIAAVLLFAGACMLLAPLAQSAMSQMVMDRQIEQVLDLRASSDSSARLDGEQDDSGDEYAQTREWLERYNKKVAAGKVSIASDPFSFEDASDTFSSQGLEDGLIGYVKIPRMSCKLPLYLGATAEHMIEGAAVVSGSSAPLGGLSTNCVIAAHRGYASAAMFRDIEKLKLGDKVLVGSLWEDMTYTVVNIKTIDPSDVEVVGVRAGEDMVTLTTCHPYGHNYLRYIVECKRDDATADDASASGEERDDSGSDDAVLDEGAPLPLIEDCLRLAGSVVFLICAVVLIARALRSRRRAE